MDGLNTPLNSFIDTGLDERLSKGYHMEQVTVHGKHRDYLAMRKKGTDVHKDQPVARHHKSDDKHGHSSTSNHSNSKKFEVIGKGFMYMPISASGSAMTLENVVEKYHSEGKSKYDNINSYIKDNYFVSDGETETADFYKVDGRYTEARVKNVHEPIIQSFVDQCPVAPKGTKPICFLYGGGSASGKSTVVHKVVDPIKEEIGGFGTVDADSIKAMLPEHEMFIKQNVDLTAAREHRESSDITNATLDRLISDGRTFAYDGTMSKFGKYDELINKMVERGYEIHIVAVDIPVEDALKRASMRERKIPESIVTGTHAAFSKNLINIIAAHTEDIDSFCLYDNSQPEGQEPTLIISSDNPENPVGNQELYERFLRKGGHLKDGGIKHE